MSGFDPTVAPPGRLARLGVVVDPESPSASAIVRFCDLAGIEIVWVTTSAAATLGGALRHARLGATTVQADDLPPSGVAEVSVTSGPHIVDRTRAVRAWIDRAGLPIRLSAEAASIVELRPLLELVDDLVLPAWHFPDLETAADEARAEAVEVGRDPATLGVAAVVPASIGRTEAEAVVRADADAAFTRLGHPRDIGIFGTLEECQDRVIAMAHAGISDLRCILPAAPDVHDVVAQLTAVTIGTTDVLIPGALRSPAPPPPEGWGGRPDQPPRPQISGGSRRR